MTKNLVIVEKVCHDSDCMEKIAKMPQEFVGAFKEFVFCPYCAEEMTLVCQACREHLSNSDYKFCPWCGVEFIGNSDNI